MQQWDAPDLNNNLCSEYIMMNHLLLLYDTNFFELPLKSGKLEGNLHGTYSTFN